MASGPRVTPLDTGLSTVMVRVPLVQKHWLKLITLLLLIVGRQRDLRWDLDDDV